MKVNFKFINYSFNPLFHPLKMTGRGRCFIISFFLLISISPCRASSDLIWPAPKELTASAQRFESLSVMLRGFVEREETPSSMLLLAKDGKVVFWEAYGMADATSGKSMHKDAICFLASSTKPISATCLMMLVDDGKLKLDDPVSKFLPAYEHVKITGSEKHSPAPTIRQLLSHTSGMAGLREMTPSAQRAIRETSLSLKESADIIAKEELLATPGTRFSYGGLSFNVAGRVLEVVSGQSFDQFMQARLLDPLGMKDTSFKPTAAQGERVASISKPAPWGGQLELYAFDIRRDSLSKKMILVGGGLYSSASDLAVFLQMHLNGGVYGGRRYLSQAAVREMQKDQIGCASVAFHPVPESRDYGLGWVQDRFGKRGGASSVSHAGMFGTIQWIDNDRNLIGVLFTPMPLKFSHPIHRLIRAQVLSLVPKEN
jgi:CubicO group peptidase (beta-lactamase class C family)